MSKLLKKFKNGENLSTNQLNSLINKYNLNNIVVSNKDKILLLKLHINNNVKQLRELAISLNLPIKKKIKYQLTKEIFIEQRYLINKGIKRTRNIIKEFINGQMNIDNSHLDLIPFKEEIDATTILKIILSEIENQLHNDFYTITVGNISGKNYITLTNKNINKILDQIKDYQSDIKYETISDGVHDILININISVFQLNRNKERKNRDSGAFFNMYNITQIDLSKFGIIKENDSMITKHCFIDSLERLGCDKKIIEGMAIKINNTHLPKKNINELANHYKIYISVKSPKNTNVTEYGNINSKHRYKLGIINHHYFPIMKVNITKFALENYHEFIKNEGELSKFNRRLSIRNDRKNCYKMLSINDESRLLNSYDTINYMIINKEKFFKPMNNCSKVMELMDRNKVNKYIDNINYSDDEVKEVDRIKLMDNYNIRLEKIKDYHIAHADFETRNFKNGDNIIQKQDCIYIDLRDRKNNIILKKTFIGDDCGKQMLNSLKTHTQIIFHNASYDYTFLQRDCFGDQNITKGKRLIQGSYFFKNFGTGKVIKIIINDSYAMIPVALKKFGKMFGMKINKADISHDYYNELINNEKINDDYQDINEAVSYIKKHKRKMNFLKNIRKWNIYDPSDFSKFNAKEYRYKYCKVDVEVQRQGYNAFSRYIKKICELDITVFPTLASLADSFLIKKGCYDEVYELSGVVREFMQKFKVGGRTMSKNNQKYHIQTKLINDFDAVALYPSAMYRMKGFLKGKPKIIIDKSNIFNYDGFFVEIIIKSVGIKRSFPLMSIIDDNGNRLWSNDMIGKTLYVDKTSLEDLIKFQDITYEVVKGYYFDEGHNNKINEVIKNLFDERVKAKNVKNPIQEIYKLLMNSAYGKSLLNPIETENIIFKDEKSAFDFMIYNHNAVNSAISIYGTKKISVNITKPINNHFNRVHIGCEILSMSKRIMNEVMCLAEDNKIDMIYQDTDSIHIVGRIGVAKLSLLYKQKYGRELIGKSMGQFHNDFKLNKRDECVISKESIILAKKCYIDRLYNEITEETGYHIRMKGVSIDAINYACEKYNCNPIELFKKLLNNQIITFDLACGQTKSLLRYRSNLTYETITIFERQIQFVGDYINESNEIIKVKNIKNRK